MSTTAIQTEASAATRRRSLWDIGADLEALNYLLFEVGGDVTDPTASAAVDEWFAEFESERSVKLDDYAGLIARLEHEAMACKAEEIEWQKRRHTRERTVEGLKDRILTYLQLHGLKELQSAKGVKFRVQANGGALPLRCELDPDTAPPSFVKFTPTIDKGMVRKALESGDVIEGAELLPRGVHVRIA